MVGSGRGNSSNKFIHVLWDAKWKIDEVRFLFRFLFRLNEIGVSFSFFYSSFLPSHTVNENELHKFVLDLEFEETAIDNVPDNNDVDET